MSEQDIIPSEATQLPEQVGAKLHPALRELSKLTSIRQFGLMLGLALSVAIGVAVVLWSQKPTYDVLFTSLNESNSAEILDVLKKSGIDYKIDDRSGAILVAPEKVRELKMQLASQGLPKIEKKAIDEGGGYALLDKEQGFGTSKGVEQVRFQRALEGEIARTIMAIQNVQGAKVLIAAPKQSVFVREHKKPSASVTVTMAKGTALDKSQVDSIVHLVASSVPLLEPEQVTVVDQLGRFLNKKPDAESEMSNATNKQFEYKKNIEDHLIERIGNILSPIVGNDGMSAQVSADVDFTMTEKTQELFNPDLPALRSEQVNEEKSINNPVQGVPGALSNQPPPAGVAPEIAAGGAADKPVPVTESKGATRNYELDKTITHTKMPAVELRRLSVAVVVDNRQIKQGDTWVSQPYSQEEILRFTDLVKQAVGFSASRGDQVTVTNAAFRVIDDQGAVSPAVWDQPWFMDVMKQVMAALVVLFLVFGVLRPTMRGLVARSEEEQKAAALAAAEAAAAAIGGVVKYDENGNPVAVPIAEPEEPAAEEEAEEEQLALTQEVEDLLLLESPQSYEKRLEYVRKLVDEDPKLVALVVKLWIQDDGKG